MIADIGRLGGITMQEGKHFEVIKVRDVSSKEKSGVKAPPRDGWYAINKCNCKIILSRERSIRDRIYLFIDEGSFYFSLIIVSAYF